MSRTDVHAPYWTWAPWYEPVHDVYCPNYRDRRWSTRPADRPCDLPERAVRHGGWPARRLVRGCTWEPVWPSRREMRWLTFGKHQPRWFVRHTWSGPERVRKRDKLGKMVKEYNATGQIYNDDFPNWQGRHCSRWLWD